MEKKVTKMYLNYLRNEEKVRMTNTLAFLKGGSEFKKEFIDLVDRVYGKDVSLDYIRDNGNIASEWGARYCGNYYYTILFFEQKDLTEKAIEVLGSCDEWDWRYFYGIAIGKEDRKLYVISYRNECSPNWNSKYEAQRIVSFNDFDFPLLKEDGRIYRMDNALHSAINDELAKNLVLFVENDYEVSMVVKDQHGNYDTISGDSVESVFRNYADNYTGYRDYRRQMASEWEIVDDADRQRFEEWKRTATGLKSGFDKFYGGGIVD